MRTIALIILCFLGLNLTAAVTPEQVQSLQQQAELGDSKAQAMLGWCYYYGEGVAKNKTEAAKWITKSKQPRETNNNVTPVAKSIAVEPTPNVQVKVENKESDYSHTGILLIVTILIILYLTYKYYKLYDSIESITRDAQKEADQIVKAANAYNEQAVSLHQQRVKELLVREKMQSIALNQLSSIKSHYKSCMT